MLSGSDWQALWLTARLAGVVTLILLVLGTPIAWWLARSRSRWKIRKKKPPRPGRLFARGVSSVQNYNVLDHTLKRISA